MAAVRITVLKRNTPWGPFNREQIEEGIKCGDFTWSYLAHAPGLNEWLPLGEVLDYAQRHPSDDAPVLPPVPVRHDLPPVPESRKPHSPPPLSRPPILPAASRPAPPPPIVVPPPQKPEVKAEPKPAVNLDPASFFLRATAFFLDGAILFLPVAVLFVLGSLGIVMSTWWHHLSNQAWREDWELLGLNSTRLSWLIIGFGWLYGAGFESSSSQATIGKKWMGLKVTDSQGERLVFTQALGRNIAKYLSGLPCFLGYFMALFSSHNLTLHDRLSDTRVILRK